MVNWHKLARISLLKMMRRKRSIKRILWPRSNRFALGIIIAGLVFIVVFLSNVFLSPLTTFQNIPSFFPISFRTTEPTLSGEYAIPSGSFELSRIDEKDMPSFDLKSESAMLIHPETGLILYEKDPHKKLHPASVAKIMTMLLALEAVERGEVSLDDMVEGTQTAKEQGGTQIFLDVGEQFSLETMLKAIAIESANDASVAVAEFIGGTVENFVDMMNTRAKELMMNDTHYINPSGLPPTEGEDSVMSSYDVALVSIELLKYPVVHEWFTTWMEFIRVGTPQEFHMVNKNRLIKGKYEYPGADGIKTGSHSGAGFCLSATAKRDDLRLIAIVMKAPTVDDRFKEVTTLLNYGFNMYKGLNICERGDFIAEVPVRFGEYDTVNLIAAEPINLIVKRDDISSVKTEIITPELFTNPVTKDQEVGELRVILNGELLGQTSLIPEIDVKRAGIFKLMGSIFRNLVVSIFETK